MSQRDEPRRRTPVIRAEPTDTENKPSETPPHTVRAFTRKQLTGEEPAPRYIESRAVLPGTAFKDCDNPACNRFTSSGAAFCCFGCSNANGKYDPEGYHSPGCNLRAAERRIPLVGGIWISLPEPEEIGTIIGFQRQFGESTTVYSYAAIKTPKGWYCTGNQRVMSWRQLLDWMGQGQESPPAIWAASDFTEITPTEEKKDG